VSERYFGDLLNDIADYQAQLAERDAEIAQLRKRVAEADQIVRAGEAERKALAAQIANLRRIVAERGLKVMELEKWKDSLLAQVAELQAWRDATPLEEIAESYFIAVEHTGGNMDTTIVGTWLEEIGYTSD